MDKSHGQMKKSMLSLIFFQEEKPNLFWQRSWRETRFLQVSNNVEHDKFINKLFAFPTSFSDLSSESVLCILLSDKKKYCLSQIFIWLLYLHICIDYRVNIFLISYLPRFCARPCVRVCANNNETMKPEDFRTVLWLISDISAHH